ncbi:MAG: hypothetical protein WC655_10005 [Candidatus Hydrogenedentales bacterium]|jgi:hypothetical protein
MNRRFAWLVWLVLASGIGFTLALQTLVPTQEVFFSGDGGEKALQMRQYAAGQFHVDLRLTSDPWTQGLWKQGLIPGDETFFVIHDKLYSIFPYTFPFVTAPFYALFGLRGLYIVPLVSVWCVWFIMALALRRMEPNPLHRALLLGALVFACPLTLYAATYWEHPTAIALAFLGFTFTLRTPDCPEPIWRGLLFGAVLGAAGWFREDSIVFASVVLLASFFHGRSRVGNRAWFAYCAGTGVAICMYFALNAWIYGNPLGSHSNQSYTELTWIERIDLAVHWFFAMCLGFVRTMPIVLFGAGVFAALARFAPKRLDGDCWYLIAVGGMTLFAVGLIVPSDGDYQIGPRFLFSIIPVVWLLIARLWSSLNALQNPMLRIGFMVAFLATLALGVKRDAVEGTAFLEESYRARVAPALTLLLERPETVVAVAGQAITQEMGVAMKTKSFFLVKKHEQLLLLVEALRERGEDEFLFIALGDEKTEYDAAIRAAGDMPLSIEPMGRFGRHFYFYAVKIAS